MAAVFFVVLVFFAKPVSSTIGYLLVILGIAMRLWAAGYIGPEARKSEFNADYVIRNGPYKFLRHPLYVGNFFLVLGVVVLFNPSRWVGITYMITFVIMYTLIAASERQYLKDKPAKEVPYKFSNLRGEISTLIVLVVVYALCFLLIVRS
jgi:protein-S-isoprenylcysteine O-methyltransferase Ste14